MTPSGRAVVPAAWALYDFANTIFSFAVVSGAIGLYLVKPEQFGERDGNVLLSLSIVISVGINAMIALAAGSIARFLGTRPTWLLLQRWLMGTVLAGLAVKLAFEAKRA